MRRRVRSWCLGAAAIGSAWATPLTAQMMVRGTAMQPDRTTPAAGALVELADGALRVVARAIVHADGSFELVAPTVGRFNVILERSGYAADVATSLDIGSATPAPLKLVAAAPQVSFTGVTAPARPDCTLGPLLTDAPASLWHAASVDLQRLMTTESSHLVFRQVTVSERDYDANEKKVKAESNPRTFKVNGRSFLSRSADSAATLGFVQGDSTYFYFDTPDAIILTSQPFLASHCFGVAAHDRVEDGKPLIGLTFKPAKVSATLTDIEGTLWIDRATGSLALFEWKYSPPPSTHGTFGGEQTLGTTPSGYAYLAKWTHRFPQSTMRSMSEGHLALSTDRQMRVAYVQSLVLAAVHESISTATVLPDR